jgi:divalent metal cation (Fe/Co/Zn/Cd) transporter
MAETAVLERTAVVLRGRRLEYFTIGWNALEGLVAVVAGAIAGSISLVGFGIDSFIEVTSGSVLLWRMFPGIVLACVSLVVMPLLSRAKRKVGRALGSAAMHADARQTEFCTYLSGILLAGLLLNAFFGLWWADPVAALIMVPIIAKEGIEGLQGKACDECRA